jgi:hypothetical protein
MSFVLMGLSSPLHVCFEIDHARQEVASHDSRRFGLAHGRTNLLHGAPAAE